MVHYQVGHLYHIISTIYITSKMACSAFTERTGEDDSCKYRSVSYGVDLIGAEIKSPRYPLFYCNNLDCTYEIEGATDSSIHLQILTFATEARYDYLKISQTFLYGGNLYSSLISKLSGTPNHTPLVVSAPGNGLKLRFVTDNGITLTGFHARFKRVNISVREKERIFCPQFFYEATGQETDLPKPSIYPTIIGRCTYQINTTIGQSVQVTVKKVAPTIEMFFYETENLYPPGLRDGSMLTKIAYNGSNKPITVTSRTQSMIILVVRVPQLNDKHSNETFEATFVRTENPCRCFSNKYTISNKEWTVITSPGYPLEYCDNLDCRTVLELDSYMTQCMVIEFETFELEDGSDHLHLFEMDKRTSKHLLSYTGSLSKLRNKQFTFFGKNAELRFITDATIINSGFNITVISVNKGCSCPNDEQTIDITSNSGTISATFPYDCLNVDCFFIFNTPVTVPQTQRMRLLVNVSYQFKAGYEEFLDVFTDTKADNIVPSLIDDKENIYDSTGNAEGFEMLNNDGPMIFWYHLYDTTKTGEGSLNFTYRWKTICQCGPKELYAEKGVWKTFTSPDYPESYCNSMSCEYQIIAPYGYIVAANITEANMEVDEDFVALFDGANINDTRIRLITGVEFFNDLIRSTGQHMTVYFKSDVSIVNKGFCMYYTAEISDKAPILNLKSSWTLMFVLFTIILVIIALIITIMTVQRRLPCFGNTANRWSSSVIAFTNIAQERNSTSSVEPFLQ